MRVRLVVAGVTLAVAGAMVGVPPAKDAAARAAGVSLVESYHPPGGDPAGVPVRGRGWTYDSAVTAAAQAADGDLDAAGALLDELQALQRPDGALESSYDLANRTGDGPLRSGNQAWVGLAAVEWRSITCSGRHDVLLAGLARWLLGRRITDTAAPGHGLVTGGPDVTWASTEHNLEVRAFFAGLAAVLDGKVADPHTGRACEPGLDGIAWADAQQLSSDLHGAVDDLDVAIARDLFARDGADRAHFRQGLEDDARPLDVQALGILWLLGHDRTADAEAVAAETDATMLVHDRTVAWPGAERQTFTGYKPYADTWGADVLWMEGTLAMRMARSRLGAGTAALDDSIDRWTALTSPDYVLQADRAGGEDYHAWPAAAPTAWLRLGRSDFGLF